MTAAWSWWQSVWPQVYPNLIAAAVQGGVVAVWARAHVRKLHARLDRVHDHLNELKKENSHGPEGP